jgi:hypothetical protein
MRSRVCGQQGAPPGVPAWNSRGAGLECLGDLEDDAVPVGSVTGYGTVRDGPGEALPHSVQLALFVTMRYLIST